jgi:hypothetical protein
MDKRIERMIEREKALSHEYLLKFLSMNQNQEHLYGK